MAGLLDSIFNTQEGRMGLGLLALGQAPRAQGFQGLMGLLAAQDDAARMKADTAWRQEQANRQRQEWEMKDGAAKAQAAQRAAIPSLFTPGEGGGVGGFDVQRALQHGFDPDEIQKLAGLSNVGRAKVARTVDGVDENGRPVTYQVDEFGQRVGDGIGQWKAPMLINQGDRQTLFDPGTRQTLGSLGINMSQAERDASARGWASQALARERMNFDMAGGAEAGKPQYKDGNWVMPPRGLQPGQAVPALPATGVKDANEALTLIDQAKKLIPNATGSYLGSAMDTAARAFGKSTSGDIATGQLQALEGALVAKMPKMSGPQSDKDVVLYRQMAGVIGDPTIPTERKLAALATVEEIQRRYAGQQAPKAPAAGSMGSGSFNSAPPDIANLLTKYGGR